MASHLQNAKRSSCVSAGCIVFGFILLLWVSSFAYFLSLRAGGGTNTLPLTTPSPSQLKAPEPRSSIATHVPHTTSTAKLSVSPQSEGDIHIVFSTDCSFFQDWQSLLVFHTASQVKQKGKITRIASGCSEEQQQTLLALYKKLYPQYGVHFTPDFKRDAKTKKKYDFYNKPYGLHHWLQHAEPPVQEGTVVILIDPDMIILRPLSLQVAGYPTLLKLPSYGEQDVPPAFVGKGHAAAQIYGLGAPWTTASKNFNRTHVCGEGSPCLQVQRLEGEKFYSVGPPYLVEKSDLLRLTDSWTSFVPKVYERYPELLAEMYAYSMAAAHERLPHYTMRHYMISNVDMDEEAWQFVDVLKDDVCQPPQDGVFYPDYLLPNILHYCQFYRIGNFGFQKRRLRKKMFECDGPLLAATPLDLGKLRYKNRDGEILKLGPRQARRSTFMLCTLHRSINAMLLHYRQAMCPPGTVIGRNETESLISKEY